MGVTKVHNSDARLKCLLYVSVFRLRHAGHVPRNPHQTLHGRARRHARGDGSGNEQSNQLARAPVADRA